MTGARFRVRGRVQGVAFRAWTRERARSLGLRGLVRNLDDGSVEVLAFGEASAIDALAHALHTGPTLARVDHVMRDAADNDVERGSFDIG